MNKRDIFACLFISIFLSIIIFCCVIKVSSSTSVHVDNFIPQDPTILVEEIIETYPQETQKPSVQEILFDNSIVYTRATDEESLYSFIENCNRYIALLQEAKLDYFDKDLEIIDLEILRVIEIVEQYDNDLKLINATVIQIPDFYDKHDFKSYESYKAIKTKSTPHYKLQRQYAETGENGIRMVNGRYCIALGSYFTTSIGQYVDIVLTNGTVIQCILGDQKDDKHTDKLHIAHKSDNSIVEFIIDLSVLDEVPKRLGDMSYAHPEWNSPVEQIIVYDINFFEELENNTSYTRE